ncbi:uncharacterized protein LOC142173737 [Nicotiana tabacum]|uniref:Uncharacterized protein LOC142173737 n=1 Tax=Nicotiana tabacum TaxID=4097 RepID=A0AC58TE21_TOBAC
MDEAIAVAELLVDFKMEPSKSKEGNAEMGEGDHDKDNEKVIAKVYKGNCKGPSLNGHGSKRNKLAYPVDRKWRAGLSHGWQSILAVKDKVEEQIMRKVNSGSSSLIWDNWTSFGAIALVINHNGTNRHQIVKDLIDNGHWNIDHLHLPEYLAEIILSIPIGNPHCPDTPICMPTTNENFSTSSAWDITRQHKEPDHFIYNIWHKSTPFNMFFLVLKMLKNKLPFYNIITRIGIEVDTKCCCCCADAKDETIHHTFLDGNLARIIWNVFGIPLGIPWEPGSIRTQMIKWWTVKPKNGLHKDLLKIIPIFILWEIWKARCANRYGKKKVSKVKVIHHIFYHIKWIVSKTNSTIQWIWKWQELTKQITSSSHKIECIIVKWIRPPMGWIKLNTDGSHNSVDSIGAGGIIRDNNEKNYNGLC